MLNRMKYTINSYRKGDKHIWVVLNVGDKWQTIDLTASYYIPDRLKVIIASIESQYREK